MNKEYVIEKLAFDFKGKFKDVVSKVKAKKAAGGFDAFAPWSKNAKIAAGVVAALGAGALGYKALTAKNSQPTDEEMYQMMEQPSAPSAGGTRSERVARQLHQMLLEQYQQQQAQQAELQPYL